MPILFELVFKNFWIIAVVIGFVNYFMFKMRIPKNIEDENEKEETNNLLKSILVFLTVPFALLGIFQILGDFKNPFFVFSKDYKNIYVILSIIVLFSTWAIVLRWVFFKDGAKILIKHKEIFRGNFPANETIIKIFFVFMILGGLLGLIFGISNDLYNQALFISN